MVKKVNEDRVLEYIVFSMQLENETFYKNIFKLKKGENVEFANEKLQLESYFKLTQPSLLNLKDDREYAEAFLELFSEVVNDHLDKDFSNSIAMSGGLDSSSILCTALNQKHKREVVASSFIFTELEGEDHTRSDESEYMNEVYEQYQNLKKI